MTTGTEDGRQRTTALDTALRETPVDELDERIGESAICAYEETVTKAALDASEPILGWWRSQGPDVVEAFLDELRADESTALLHLEELTETSGLELLGELIRDTGPNNGRETYEHRIRHHLDTVRAENAVASDSETPALDAALATLHGNEITTTFGLDATAAYCWQIGHAEHQAAMKIVNDWRHRPWGARAIEELVATLENDHPEEIEEATRLSAGGAANDLVAILRNDTTRELYERLVTRRAERKTRPAT